MRLELEEHDALGPERASTASSARAEPGRVATPSRASSSTRSGSFHVGKAANSSAPTRNTGSSSRARLERVDGARVRLELDLGARTPANASRASASRTSAGVSTRLCPGRRRRDEQPRRAPKCSTRRRGERHVADVRRVEGAAEDPTGSLPLEHLVADLDLRALADAGGPQRRLELLALRRRRRRPGSRGRCARSR